MTHRRVQRLRTAIRVLFLALFLVLAVQGRVQLWLPVFVAGVLLSLIFSRFYCGWICQMGTLFSLVNRLKARLKIPQLNPPEALGKVPIRWIVLVLTFGSMIMLKRLGVRADVLVWITGLSIVLTFFLSESFWHNYLCPYGAILSLTTRPAPLRMRVVEENCIACGKCESVCPSLSIGPASPDSKKRRVVHRDCLVCAACAVACPPDVIRYGK